MRNAKVIKKKAKVNPDPKYNSVLVQKFVNHIMLAGKKNVAYKIFYSTMDTVEKKTNENGLEVWKRALENVCPSIETKRRRIGGLTSQVPVDINEKRKFYLGTKWIVEAARKGSGKTMVNKLTNEIISASQNEGKAVKKKIDVHKMAEANKAFTFLKK